MKKLWIITIGLFLSFSVYGQNCSNSDECNNGKCIEGVCYDRCQNDNSCSDGSFCSEWTYTCLSKGKTLCLNLDEGEYTICEEGEVCVLEKCVPQTGDNCDAWAKDRDSSSTCTGDLAKKYSCVGSHENNFPGECIPKCTFSGKCPEGLVCERGTYFCLKEGEETHMDDSMNGGYIVLKCGTSICDRATEKCENEVCTLKDGVAGNGNGTPHCAYSNASKNSLFLFLSLFSLIILMRKKKQN